MTAFISEFRSMTFQCKSAISSSIQFSEINSYIGRDRIMAPQQHDALAKSSEQLLHSEQTRENPVSPISSLGTSMESSSPALHSDVAIENHQNFETERSLVVDPSSDDSNSIPNDLSGNQVELRSHLEKLQSTVGKVGRNGPELHLSEYSEQKDDVLNNSNASLSSVEQSYVYYDNNELYKCHLCTFASNLKQEFNTHMNTHFDHKCPSCDYTSRTEGRLRRHVKDFHSKNPPDSWAGTRVPRTEINSAEQSMDDSVTSSNGKSRTYRCKQCDFIAYQKNEFWEHNKTHIKAEKLLSCPKCAFVTEYKHHLEYHLRNHFGSKPFKCTKCNYSCVNKSMLNSHMKSHSNIYQYRCTDCTYATKYCHSLKLHLRKYDHKPATVLNVDGTPNPYPVIDVYGTRRGPRTKKRRMLEDSENSSLSSTAVVTSQQSMNYSPAVPLLPPNVPMMYPSHIFNGYQSNAFMKAHLDNSSYPMPHVRVKHDANFNCHMCDFITDNHDTFQKHMIMHAAAENQDIVKLYGINSDYLLHLQEQQMSFNNYVQSQRHYMEHLPRDERHNFDTHNMRERHAISYEPDVRNIKYEEESVNYPGDENRVSPRNDSRKESSSTPTYRCNSASSSQHDKYEKDSSEDNERSVIVAHRSSPNAAYRSSPNAVVELMDTQPPADKNAEHSPLDLSGPKLSDSGVCKSKTESSVEKQNPELTKSSSPLGMDTCHMPSSIHRNRRKGKAFKIDHYIQVDDQPFQSEMPSRESDQSNNTEPHKNGNVNSHHEITPSRQNNSQILEVSNTCISTEQPQNTQFHVMNSANNSSKSDYTSQNHRSPITHKSPHESPNIFNGSFATVSEGNNPQTHERDSVGACRSVPQPSQMPKVETDVQTDTAKKIYECNYCAMAFKDHIMYTLHKGYHGYADPFTCNMCGTESKNRVDFFIHIASAPHH